MNLSRPGRLALLVVAAALGLTACATGGSDGDAGSSDTGAAETAVNNAEGAAQDEGQAAGSQSPPDEPTAAESADPDGSATSASSAEAATDDPAPDHAAIERIVTVHNIGTAPLLDLGVIPVGRGPVAENQVTPELWDRIKDVPVVASGGELEIEKIAALDPDLIISHNAMDVGVATQLEAIAPVLVVDIAGAGRADWQGRVEQIATKLGMTAHYQQLLDDFTARTASIKSEYAEVLAENTFSVISSWEPGKFIIHGSDSLFSKPFTRSGMVTAPSSEKVAQGGDAHEAEVSIEKLAIVDGSVILHSTDMRGDVASESLQQLMESELFAQLPAAEAEQVYGGGRSTIGSFASANYNLDVFEAALAALQ